MVRSLVASFLLGCLASCSLADSSNTSITVTDELGAAAANARIQILWDPASRQAEENAQSSGEVVLKTDARGLANAHLRPGFYDLFVSSPAFTPECRKVRIKLGHPVKIVIPPKVDPLVAAEIGHQIEDPPE